MQVVFIGDRSSILNVYILFVKACHLTAQHEPIHNLLKALSLGVNAESIWISNPERTLLISIK